MFKTLCRIGHSVAREANDKRQDRRAQPNPQVSPGKTHASQRKRYAVGSSIAVKKRTLVISFDLFFIPQSCS